MYIARFRRSSLTKIGSLLFGNPLLTLNSLAGAQNCLVHPACSYSMYVLVYSISYITDKRTDVWSPDFIIWIIKAVVWAGLWNKRVWADYEQL